MKNIFFDQFPEFILQDTRNNRLYSPVTSESLSNRHKISLPKELINGCTVLDLGSCLGATGHWCLSNGATHYTGVEVQSAFVDKSRSLLSKYWEDTRFEIYQNDILEFLECNSSTYDIVVLVGVIYSFLDQYNLLTKISKICNKILVVDCIYPRIGKKKLAIEIVPDQAINSDSANKSYKGVGARISPNALRLMMQTLGFEDKDDLLIPAPLTDKNLHDTYSTIFADTNFPTRYLLRFVRTNIFNLKLVNDVIVKNDLSKSISFDDMKFRSPITKKFVFDESVAIRFQKEAEQHIPDYHRVIDLCIDYINVTFDNKDIKVIDVGSALGFTLKKVIDGGYNNTYGVENSQDMIDKSVYPERVTLSDNLPNGPWDVVLANWTLHFVLDRKEYIQCIFNEMNYDGLLILTDKMSFSNESNELYFNFKRQSGVSEQDIAAKEQSLVGVLTCKPLQWYLDILKEIGFRDIQIINSRYMFNTICARK